MVPTVPAHSHSALDGASLLAFISSFVAEVADGHTIDSGSHDNKRRQFSPEDRTPFQRAIESHKSETDGRSNKRRKISPIESTLAEKDLPSKESEESELSEARS